ncbi:hypothetical protein BDV23DRAFT_146405 [Aspergillus alliaceus]|uniref:DUF7707 domain-containing protein n=1 Tax=Petromyces alliaceus TaxID=209559 RepID=A0A5N6FUY2_PETAA|nr:uncharacterized protein BDW43DRAFT_278906 [Aspergillus alliaceus]KAB8232544.1 hypothetical protein BDW43DRAFT_278906 [Aspergillus alliaceus]KAE8394799.1 hypothetical protein BDV23DRAFT_146405 [Aspergillus alliaceus]
MLPILFLSTLVASAAAATTASNYTFPDGFDLNQVKQGDKSAWCLAERNACPKICGGVAEKNTCDSQTLEFTCTCSNGTDADVAPYAQTIPFYVCQENYRQCIQRSTDLDGDEKCKKAQSQCGSKNVSDASGTSASTTTATSLPKSTGSSGSSNHETSSTGTATSSGSTSTTTPNAAVGMAQDHATGILATVLFLGLHLVL